MPEKQVAEVPQTAHEEVESLQTWDPDADQVAGGPPKGAFVPSKGAGAGTSFADVKSEGPGVEKARRAQLKDGKLTLEEIAALDLATIKRINPKSAVPRNILKLPLKGSWNKAKKTLVSGAKMPGDLAAPSAEQKKNRKLLMKKIWEFRQWDYWEVLKLVAGDLAKTDGQPDRNPDVSRPGLDLTETSSAGSTTVTSDIDVNLKGSRTEEAAELFNQKFKTTRGGWSYESGVVYDVNVYALDVLHGKVKEEAPDGTKTVRSKKEGKREGMDGGGFKKPEDGESPSDVMLKDSADQDVQALLHLRIYMTADQWAAYKKTAEANGSKQKGLLEVERRFERYQSTIMDQMLRDAGIEDKRTRRAEVKKAKADLDNKLSGEQQLESLGVSQSGGDHIAGENALIAASNRIYERKAKGVAELRKQLAGQIKFLELMDGSKLSIPDQEKEVEETLFLLRKAISDMLLYANEVYVTDASVNHAVLGTQANLGITQSLEESRRVVDENAGDVLKTVSGYKADQWAKAGFKAGKYLWRLADGARNMDTGEFAPHMASLKGEIGQTYRVGETLANDIKVGMEPEGEEAQVAAAKPVLKSAGLTSNDKIAGRAIDISLKLNKAFSAFKAAGKNSGADANKVAGAPEAFRA